MNIGRKLEKLEKFFQVFHLEWSGCMDMQEVTAQYRLSKWMQVIQERQSSGQKIKDFCQEKVLR